LHFSVTRSLGTLSDSGFAMTIAPFRTVGEPALYASQSTHFSGRHFKP
jgi:hypothetical protein